MRPSIQAAAGFVLAVSTLWGTASRAEIIFCNQFPHLIYVAMAYQQTGGSFMSRGWMSLSPGDCSRFDSALRVKTFYFRAESERYRDDRGQRTKYVWGKGRAFAISENNFQYYDAEHQSKATLAEFTQGPEAESGDVSAKVTFREGGTAVEF